MTVLLASLDQTDQLFNLLGPPQPNPGYGSPEQAAMIVNVAWTDPDSACSCGS